MTKLVRAVLVLILLMATIANLRTDLKQGRGALLIVLAGLALAPRVWRWLSGRSATTKRNLCWGLLGLTAVIELTVLLTMPTSVFHDPFRVRYQASLLASGHFDWGASDYFYRYPNNAVNAVLLAGPLWVGRLVGFNDATTLGALGFVMTNALILACAHLASRLAKDRAAAILVVAWFLLNSVTYTNFLQVPYSDLPSILAVAVILLVWQAHQERPHWAKLLVLGGAVLVGQLIKPNLIVLAPAVLLTWCLVKPRRQLLAPVTTVLVALALTLPVKQALLTAGHYQANDRYRLPATSWIYMSYLPATGGQYNSQVVQQEETLPNLATRQRFVQSALVNQVKKLGVGGLFQQWGTKLVNLTDERHVPIEYRAGPQRAPAWYLAHAKLAGVLQNFLLQVGWLTLFALTLRKVIYLRLNSATAVLLAVWTVGFVAFEVLLWEVEDRYGLALLPFLFGLVSLPTAPRFNDVGVRLPWFWWPLVGLVGALLLLTSLSKPNSITVATQQSSLSVQYGERPYRLAPGAQLSQVVTLHHAATRAQVWLPNKSRATVTLLTPAGKRLALHRRGGAVAYRGELVAGTYRLVVANLTTHAQPVWITSWPHGRLAPHPLVINRHTTGDRSLRYLFSTD